MERTTFSLLFYIRRTKLNKAGEAPIFMRVTVNGLRADASVKRFVAPRLWNIAKGKAVENGRGCRELNLYLDAVSANVLRARRNLELEGAEISAHTVLNRYLGKDRPVRHTLVEVFVEHNEKQKKLAGIDVAPATAVRYETCRKLIEQFLRQAYRRNDIYLDELSRQFVEDYEFFLKTERRCSHNTTIQYLKNLKKIIRIAMMKGWLLADPFAEIRFHKEPVERDFLEKAELKKLLDKSIDISRLSQVRDIFGFCCLTGLAFSDVKQLRPEHIAIDINGLHWIRKPRQKTGSMCNIPIMDCGAGDSIPVQRQCLLPNAWRIVACEQQPEDECLFERVGRYMRYSQAPFDAYGLAHVRNADPRQRRDYRERRQNARPCRYENDATLCPDSRFVDPAGYADRCQKHGIVKPAAPLHPTRLVGIFPGAKGRRQNKSLAQSPTNRPLRARGFSQKAITY